MKKTMLLFLLLAILALTACGQQAAPAAETPQNSDAAQIPNPWRDITEQEAKALCPGDLKAPEGAEHVRWSVMESAGKPPLVQLSFDLNGLSFTAREQATNDIAADISGMYYPWTIELETTLNNWGDGGRSGTYSRYMGQDEWADLCAWYDAGKGVSYTLSVTAKNLDGFDLQAIAEALCAAPSPALESGRQNGERFDAVIIMEGMEELVRCEHIRNDSIGVELDYDYERFERRSDADRERFISVYDAPQHPENYLELTYSPESADAAAESARAALSRDYELLESTRELAKAGSCLRIEASVLKGTNTMGDEIQVVYIIPSADGCRVATAHYAVEAAEGFGRRFSYLLNTLAVIDRSAETKLTDRQALSAIRSYCFAQNPGLEEIVNAGEYPAYWELVSGSDAQIVVLFRSYTGAQIRYYIDPVSGESYVTEFVPGITSEEQRTEERFNARDYLLSIPGTWQTASIVFENDGTAQPEYHVRFADGEILYGHVKDGAFVPDHADAVSRFAKTPAGGFLVRAEASNGVRYSYRTSESDNSVMEYFETWNEADFPSMYRGGASLSRSD